MGIFLYFLMTYHAHVLFGNNKNKSKKKKKVTVFVRLKDKTDLGQNFGTM